MRTANSQRIRTSPGRSRARRPLLALASAVLVITSLIAVPAASASRSQTTLFDLGGVALDITPQARAEQLDELQAFGVDTVRAIVTWRQIAPEPDSASKPAFNASDPAAYPPEKWAGLDDLVRGARSRGMDLLLTPSTPVPIWGSRAREQFTDPDPAEFQQFIQALGTRYSGGYTPAATPTDPAPTALPRIDRWSVLNEPNLTLFLRPQFRGGRSVAGKLYRELFLAAQRGLQASGHGEDTLLIGETSPGPGRGGTDPITFLRGVFCLNAKFKRSGACPRIDADGWAQHPYDPINAPFESSKSLINLVTITRLVQALNKAKAAGRVTRRLPIYVTEFGVESVPDRKFGVSLLRQAEYLGISEYLMYRNGRIRSFGQYLMNDDQGNAQVNFQTGLRFSDGRQKLSYKAFAIALVAQLPNPRRSQVTIWGHVRPSGAPYTVKVKSRGPGPDPTKTVRTNANGYFQFRTPFREGRRYSASTRLPDGTELTGPFVRVYSFK